MAFTLKDYSQLSIIRKNPCPSNEIMKNLYKQRIETGDIVFMVESKEIHAHRSVLAATSLKYKAQFYGPLSDKDVIHVNDVSHDAFMEFLKLPSNR